MIREKIETTVAYRELCVAVLLQAVTDLKKALIVKANIKDPRQLRKAEHIIQETSRFLRDTNSPYHQMLNVDPHIYPELVDKLLGNFAE